MAAALDAPNALANPHLDDLSGGAHRGVLRLRHLASRAASMTLARTEDATTAMQALPDASLRDLAASSVGLGVGLYLTRQPRVLVLAGIVPAFLAMLAIRRRPARPTVRQLTGTGEKAAHRDLVHPMEEMA